MYEKFKSRKTLLSGLLILVLVISFSAFYYFVNRGEKIDTGLSQRVVTGYNNLADDAIFNTSLGVFTIHFLKDKAPLSVNTFIKLADAGKYNGITIDKMTSEVFTVQAPTSSSVVKWSEVNNEKMSFGSVAVFNSDSNDGAFFVVDTYEALDLQGKHAVFARVTKGLEVLEKIAKAPHDSKGNPVPAIKIIKVDLK